VIYTIMSELQWDLLRGVAPSGEAGPSRNRELATSLVETEFKAVLTSDEARTVLSIPGLLDGLVPSPSTSTSTSTPDAETTLIVAIALLHAFVQTNWTGPDLDFTPLDLFPGQSTTAEDINAAALPFLTLQGEPAYHLSAHVSLFLLSLRLLASLDDGTIPTLPWWKLRLHLVHQALLDEPVSIDPKTLESLRALRENEVLKEDQDLLASLDLEIGLYYHSLGMDKPANKEFLSAAKASGLEFELSGALGRKTKFQRNAQSQLILLAESRRREGDEVVKNGESSKNGEEKDGLPTALLLNDDTLLEDTEFTKVTSGDPASTSRLAHLDPTDQPPLHPLDQSLLLSFCLSQHNHMPSSGLTANQMMPFISRVVAHPRNWSVHTTALLLRSRLESTRSRTVERSALQLQALIEQMPTSDFTPTERLKYYHQLPLPSKWEMEKELATRYMSLGVIRSALEIYSRLEMWEDAVGCLQRLEKEEEAEKIVRDLLEGRKIESDLVHTRARSNLSENRLHKLTSAREAKLWCLLGDLALNSFEATKDPENAKKTAIEHYEKAWEVSDHTSSRAMRSMGSLKFGLGDFEASIPCLQHAVAINPLYARVWFTMGVSYVKLEKWSDARDAFRRLVNVDEEDAEGWNNLAAVYLRIGEEGRNKDEVSTIRNLISTELISAPSTCLIRQQALGVQSTTTGSTTRSP
jgi:tetratricopeptide (TPR) repeat protein